MLLVVGFVVVISGKVMTLVEGCHGGSPGCLGWAGSGGARTLGMGLGRDAVEVTVTVTKSLGGRPPGCCGQGTLFCGAPRVTRWIGTVKNNFI